jgi:hypothetical protein
MQNSVVETERAFGKLELTTQEITDLNRREKEGRQRQKEMKSQRENGE